jgi:hypothetical protein
LLELPELREEASRLAARLAALQLRDAQGLPYGEKLTDVLRGHRLAVSADGLAQAREALAEAFDEDPKRPGRVARLSALREFLARVRAIELEPGAAQELFERPRRALVRPPGDAGLHGALPPVAVERQLVFERDREKRAELEAALADASRTFDGARGAAFEAQLAALAEAGLDAKPDVTQAEQVLQRTDAIARDLGAWLLERSSGVKGGFARHDLLHLQHAPRCASAFPRGELLRTVRRWAEMLRFDFTSDKALRLDEEDRPLKRQGASAFPVDPPYEATLSVLVEEGPRALSSLLFAIGAGQLWIGPASDAPPEDLWLGERAVQVACGALFEGLLREPQFLRRSAKADLSRDDERALAMASVFDVRLCAARAIASARARELGPGARAAEAHRELHLRATLCELPLGLALEGIDAFPDALDELRGRILAAGIRVFLRERFDEDFWRNPRAIQPLQSVWSRGGRNTAAELWAETGEQPGLTPLVAELEAACR